VSLEKLVLPPASIAALYGKSLVEPVDEMQASGPAAKEIAGEYSIKGSNNGKISLLVNDSADPILSVHHLQFLIRMLEACKMNIDDVAILNHAHQNIQIKQLKIQLAPTRVVLFGIRSIDIGLPVNFPLFNPQVYDGVTYLFVPSLQELNQENEEGKLLKSKLWVCLRQLFGI